MNASIKKAADDWQRFLLKRAKELKNGGLLVMANICRSTTSGDQPLDEAWLASARCLVLGFLQVIHDVVRAGKLTEEEESAVVCPAYARTEEELREPFENRYSLVSKAGLKLVQFEAVAVACPNERLFKSGEISKACFGEKTALSIRTWTYQLTYRALRKDRTEAEKDEIVDLIYSKLAQKLGEDNTWSTLPYAMAIMVVQKTF